MSQEVEDMLKDGNFPLDVIRYRTPRCWMPAPEAFQARITPAYQLDRSVAQEYLRSALEARNLAGCSDCSTCPERLIFDHLWLGGAFLANSVEESNPYRHKWSYLESTKPRWFELLHMDTWSKAQYTQRSGAGADFSLMDLEKKGQSRCIWPVSREKYPVENVASSVAMKDALA